MEDDGEAPLLRSVRLTPPTSDVLAIPNNGSAAIHTVERLRIIRLATSDECDRRGVRARPRSLHGAGSGGGFRSVALGPRFFRCNLGKAPEFWFWGDVERASPGSRRLNRSCGRTGGSLRSLSRSPLNGVSLDGGTSMTHELEPHGTRRSLLNLPRRFQTPSTPIRRRQSSPQRRGRSLFDDAATPFDALQPGVEPVGAPRRRLTPVSLYGLVVMGTVSASNLRDEVLALHL